MLFPFMLLWLSVVSGEDAKKSSMFVTDSSNNTGAKFDDWLSLPEVFSKLDFDADNTPAADDDIEGQMKLRNNRYWGRVYIEGFPQPIQYFRAHFGIEPPMGRKHFVFPTQRDACAAFTLPAIVDSQSGAAVSPSDIVVLAHRGTCSFGVKSTNVLNSGAGGFIMINNEPGLEHHPSPDTHDIQLSVTSIAQPEGQLLELIYDGHSDAHGTTPLAGFMIPINCGNSGANCNACTVEEREYINALSFGGYMKLSSSTAHSTDMEYLVAHFGTKMVNTTNNFEFVMAKPAEACEELVSTDDFYKGKVVLVRRGGCPFVKKAENVQAAGGVFMLVGSKHPYLVRMGVEPRWKGLSITIPIAMISKHSYSALFAETVASPHTKLSFHSGNVSDAQWETLEKLYNGEGWPRTTTFAAKKYEELKAEHKDWKDRLNTVEEAYKRFVDDKDKKNNGKKDEL